MQNISVIAFASIILTSCGGGGEEGGAENSDSTSVAREHHQIAVTTIDLKPTNFSHYFTVQGVVEADKNAQLFPEASGKVTSILVKEGEMVTKGQTLMTMDSRIVAEQINELKTRLTLAKTMYEKQEALWSKEIGSEIQYLQAKNNYESLESNLDALQSQQALYTVSAPFSGEVDEITPKIGEMANPMMAAFRLINMNDVYVKADVTEMYMSKIKAGDSVIVSFPSINYSVNTTITRLGNFINPNNRTFKVKLGLPNSKQVLKPNMLGELNIRDYHSKKSVVIATSMIQMTPSGQEFVYIVEGGIAKKVEITTGINYEGQIEVLSGLSGTETLIDKGARSVKDGDEVDVRS